MKHYYMKAHLGHIHAENKWEAMEVLGERILLMDKYQLEKVLLDSLDADFDGSCSTDTYADCKEYEDAEV